VCLVALDNVAHAVAPQREAKQRPEAPRAGPGVLRRERRATKQPVSLRRPSGQRVIAVQSVRWPVSSGARPFLVKRCLSSYSRYAETDGGVTSCRVLAKTRASIPVTHESSDPVDLFSKGLHVASGSPHSSKIFPALFLRAWQGSPVRAIISIYRRTIYRDWNESIASGVPEQDLAFHYGERGSSWLCFTALPPSGCPARLHDACGYLDASSSPLERQRAVPRLVLTSAGAMGNHVSVGQRGTYYLCSVKNVRCRYGRQARSCRQERMCAWTTARIEP
jgi:hypothetical protein